MKHCVYEWVQALNEPTQNLTIKPGYRRHDYPYLRLLPSFKLAANYALRLQILRYFLTLVLFKIILKLLSPNVSFMDEIEQ